MKNTIGIIVRNGENYIKFALQSLLNQTVLPDEILVLDDGSTDDTAAIVRALDCNLIRVIHQEPAGIPTARAAVLEHARFDYISFIDHDDIAPPLRVESLCFAIENAKRCVGAFGAWQNFLDPSIVNSPYAAEFSGKTNIQKKWWMSTGLVKSSVLRDFMPAVCSPTQLFETQWVMNLFDSELSFATTDQIVLKRRIHKTNDSHNKDHAGIVEMFRQRIRKNNQN